MPIPKGGARWQAPDLRATGRSGAAGQLDRGQRRRPDRRHPASNLAGGSNTIELARGADFTLTTVDNVTNGANGLPVISAGNNLTIRGKGATIARSTVPGTPAFRLFEVAVGAGLTLTDLTLANGLAIDTTITVSPNEPVRLGGSATLGGGILNTGALLTLNKVTVVNNQADASALGGVNAGGGGVANVSGVYPYGHQ